MRKGGLSSAKVSGVQVPVLQSQKVHEIPTRDPWDIARIGRDVVRWTMGPGKRCRSCIRADDEGRV